MYDRLLFELDDGIKTKDFGYVRFLTVEDLKKLKYRYEVITQSISYTTELFGLDASLSNFIVFFLKYSNGEKLQVEDIFTGETHSAIDVFVDMLSVIFNTKNISVDTINMMILIDGKYNLNIGNYEQLEEILLKSLCVQKAKLKKEGNQFKDDATRKRFERYYARKREKQIKEMKKNSIENIIRGVKVSLNMFSRKNELNKMTLYDLINSYTNPMVKENYERNYTALLAGADKKDLDLTHWAIKIAIIV